MKIILISDAFPPLKTSASNQIYDLAISLSTLGIEVLIFTPDSTIKSSFIEELTERIKVYRIKTPKFKDVGHLRRTLGELYMPYKIYRFIKKRKELEISINGIIWYSPTIFFGPLVKRLKKIYKCRTYLIVRDIFPKWALDLGILKKGPAYYFFEFFENLQYLQADTIGIQSKTDLEHFKNRKERVEVLRNWITPQENIGCDITLDRKKINFVYCGNMGLAQEVNLLIDAVKEINIPKLNFSFIGRGTEVSKLKNRVKEENISNIYFYDEIPVSQIPSLMDQSDYGLLSLNQDLENGNIPGKFLSYIAYGLPVFASINRKNELNDIIKEKGVGVSSSEGSKESIIEGIKNLLSMNREEASKNCISLYHELFETKNTTRKIIGSLSR